MKQRDLTKKLEDAGFSFESDIEKIPRHKEINENLARMIHRKWKLL